MNKTKKRVLILVLLCGIGAYTIHSPIPAQVMARWTNTTPAISARSAVLMDAATGDILYARDADEERAPASTTKLMSLLLVMKAVASHRASWDEVVPVPKEALVLAANPDYSNAQLRPHDAFTLRQMTAFMAVLSANDATVAVAVTLAGDEAAFVRQMNDEAKTLGLAHTHFSNPDGLPANNHYASASDLAKLARYLIQTYPSVLTFTSMPTVDIHGSQRPTTDELLGHYEGLDGLKTGYTEGAGYCFVGTAKRGGRRLVAVVMGSGSNDPNTRFTDVSRLLDYGFRKVDA